VTRWSRLLLGSALLVALISCREQRAAPIRIVLGPSPADEVTLTPRASLAEYIEVSPAETDLLLSFTTEERSCDSAPEVSQDAVGLSLRIVLPEGQKLAVGSFPLLADSQGAKGGYATATVKLRGQRRALLPGGSVELKALDLNPQGSVEGLLKLEFPGDAEHPASRVSGRFSAYFCRINRLR
jgi:hypothetical protein